MSRKMFMTILAGHFMLIGFVYDVIAKEQISNDVIKVAVLTDLSGTYADFGGSGSVQAAQMAIEDIGGTIFGKPIQLLKADHKNKTEIAANIAKKWYSYDKVDVISGLTSSGCALAVSSIAQAMKGISLISGAASTKITNENCKTNTVHWTFDTYSNSVGTTSAVLKQGGKKWFIITADYAFGLSMEKDTIKVVEENGGVVVGTVRHPLSSLDFTPYLLQAKASGADIIGLANAGADTINCVKQAKRLGITPNQTLVGLVLTLREIHSIGLKNAAGMLFTVGYYWDFDDETRAWARRFYDSQKKMPNMVHAGVYSSLMHYFKAVNATQTDQPDKVMHKMKELKVNDMFARDGVIRDDGRMVHDMFLIQVKSPSESSKPWDYFKIKQIIPGEEAFQPISQTRCNLIK